MEQPYRLQVVDLFNFEGYVLRSIHVFDGENWLKLRKNTEVGLSFSKSLLYKETSPLSNHKTSFKHLEKL